MHEDQKKQFNHLKIHTQYSICEGAIQTLDLAKHCKENKIKATTNDQKYRSRPYPKGCLELGSRLALCVPSNRSSWLAESALE